MSSTIADTPQSLGRRIAVRSDGLHCLPWHPNQRPDGTLPPNHINLWTNQDDLQILDLAWDLPLHQPETAFVGNRIVIADAPSGVGPVQVQEYDAETLAQAGTFQFGDSNTRTGCGCQTRDGGMVLVNFVTFGLNQPTYALDVAYRANLPPIPGTPSLWRYQRFTLPNQDPGTYMSPMDCVEVGGTLYLFHGFDGSGRFDLFMLNLADFSFVQQVGFLGRNGGDVSPCLEIPYITASLDKAGNRILLAYQGVDQTPTNCPGGSQQLAYPTLLTAMDLGTRKCTLLKKLPWDLFHMYAWSPVPMWARPNGIYFPSIKRTDCDTSLAWYGLALDSEIVQLGEDIPAGLLKTCSNDGWMIYQVGVDPVHVLTRIEAAPKLGIVKTANAISVSWDYALDSDVLEWSEDLKTWEPVYRGLPPFEMQIVDSKCYFRVRR